MKNPNLNSFLLLDQNLSSKAIISPSGIYTFGELREKVLQRSQYFLENKVQPNDKVAIIIDHTIHFVIAVLALWQISAVPVPISTKLTAKEIEDQIVMAGCKSVVIRKEFIYKVPKNLNIIENDIENVNNKNYEGRTKIYPDEAAVLIFTSGSSSKSKGVILSYSSLFNSAINSNHLLRYSHSDKWMASLPFYHVGGFSIITRSLVFGIPLIIPESLLVDNLESAINKFQPTLLSLVTAQLKYLVDKEIQPIPELKNCLLGGGFSDNELIKDAIELGWPICKVYGSTETSSLITALTRDEFIFKPGSAGRVLPSNKIFISGGDEEELKPFEIGEIVIQSNSLMSGYLNDDDSKKIYRNGYYYSGDIGYFDDEGYLYVTGRKNHLISSGGENVNPSEVEAELCKHPEIEEACVFPIEDKKWGEIVAASVVLKNNSSKLSYDEIKSFLQKRMAGFKIPKKIFFEESLPKTELGKIEKDKLINRYR